MLKRMVTVTGSMIVLLLLLTQVVIPHVRRNRAPDELRLLVLQKGREVIQRAVQSHGSLENWQKKLNVSFRLIDHWNSAAGTAFASVLDFWPENHVETSQYYILRRNTGRIEMTTPRGYHQWGYFDFRPWALLNGNTDPENLRRARFTIPTISYLFELPYKFLDNGVFPEFVNEVKDGDRICDRVRITFGLNAGNYPTDWFLADFDQESGRLLHLEYTIREKMPGYFHFSVDFNNYQQIDGLWIPTTADFKMTSPLLSLALHKWQIEDVQFNVGVEESFFMPPSLSLANAGAH